MLHIPFSAFEKKNPGAPQQARALLRLLGDHGGGVADGVLGGSGAGIGVLHRLAVDVGGAGLLGPAVLVLLGRLLVHVLGLEGAEW